MEQWQLGAILVSFILGFGILLLIAVIRRPNLTVKSPWRHYFPGMQIPQSEFFDRVKEALAEWQLTHVTISQESFLETHILSSMRVYLCISFNEYRFYVGAAPFGTGTFVSEWLCVKDELFINRIPIISKLFGIDRKQKTFYQRDTEAMHRDAIHTAVLKAVDSFTNIHGARSLADNERQYQLN